MGARKKAINDAIQRHQNSGKVKASKRRAYHNGKRVPTRMGNLSKSGGFRTYDQ